jgi:hypothetical protein
MFAIENDAVDLLYNIVPLHKGVNIHLAIKRRSFSS